MDENEKENQTASLEIIKMNIAITIATFKSYENNELSFEEAVTFLNNLRFMDFILDERFRAFPDMAQGISETLTMDNIPPNVRYGNLFAFALLLKKYQLAYMILRNIDLDYDLCSWDKTKTKTMDVKTLIKHEQELTPNNLDLKNMEGFARIKALMQEKESGLNARNS